MRTWLQTWEPRVVTRESETFASKFLIRPGEFCGWDQLSPRRLLEIDAGISGFATIDQAKSLRKQLLVEKCRSCTFKISKREQQIREDYELRGKGLLDISARLDIPPIAILRAILKLRVLEAWRRLEGDPYAVPNSLTARLHKKTVTAALRGSDCDLLPLSPRDRAELAAGSAADEASFEGAEGMREQEDGAAFEASISQAPPRRTRPRPDRCGRAPIAAATPAGSRPIVSAREFLCTPGRTRPNIRLDARRGKCRGRTGAAVQPGRAGPRRGEGGSRPSSRGRRRRSALRRGRNAAQERPRRFPRRASRRGTRAAPVFQRPAPVRPAA